MTKPADVVRRRATFRDDRGAVAEARRFVAGVLTGRCDDDTIDAAVLLTSEVASNAILHGRSAPTVTVTVADVVRVEVADSSPVLPVRKRYGAGATTGRGLLLLEMLTSSWGTKTNPSGKCVWFELPLAASPAVPATTGIPTFQDGGVDLDALAAAFGEGDADGAGSQDPRPRLDAAGVPALAGTAGG